MFRFLYSTSFHSFSFFPISKMRDSEMLRMMWFEIWHVIRPDMDMWCISSSFHLLVSFFLTFSFLSFLIFSFFPYFFLLSFLLIPFFASSLPFLLVHFPPTTCLSSLRHVLIFHSIISVSVHFFTSLFLTVWFYATSFGSEWRTRRNRQTFT